MTGLIISDFNKKLDLMIPNPKCELNYEKDYELLIAVILSAQCTDKRVNQVTKVLFNKYDLFGLANEYVNVIENIIRPCGTSNRKSRYISEVAKILFNNYDGKVPNSRSVLESLPGVGRKTCNVVLSNLFGVEAIAVDTHVERVSKRLGIVSNKSDVCKVEQVLMKKIPRELWTRTHHQLVLFGRYTCMARKPKCDECLFKDECKYYRKCN